MEIKPMDNIYSDDYIGLVKLKTRVDILVEMLAKDRFMSVEDICSILGYEQTGTPKTFTVTELCDLYAGDKPIALYDYKDSRKDSYFEGNKSDAVNTEWSNREVKCFCLTNNFLGIGI